ncbi:hypothetical protein Taro_012598 [Colocasia esculenta]|uniref:ISE2-like SH3 domain-containing protein n=1 Tax=Colocasia esculenta TaxID=4460 RepID=A0A843UJN2_COLES|nr:hypothetical protein [Colocasia esculenta]
MAAGITAVAQGGCLAARDHRMRLLPLVSFDLPSLNILEKKWIKMVYKTGFPNDSLAQGNPLPRNTLKEILMKENMQWEKLADSEFGPLWCMEGSLETWSWSLNVPVLSSLSEDDELFSILDVQKKPCTTGIHPPSTRCEASALGKCKRKGRSSPSGIDISSIPLHAELVSMEGCAQCHADIIGFQRTIEEASKRLADRQAAYQALTEGAAEAEAATTALEQEFADSQTRLLALQASLADLRRGPHASSSGATFRVLGLALGIFSLNFAFVAFLKI